MLLRRACQYLSALRYDFFLNASFRHLFNALFSKAGLGTSNKEHSTLNFEVYFNYPAPKERSLRGNYEVKYRFERLNDEAISLMRATGHAKEIAASANSIANEYNYGLLAMTVQGLRSEALLPVNFADRSIDFR